MNGLDSLSAVQCQKFWIHCDMSQKKMTLNLKSIISVGQYLFVAIEMGLFLSLTSFITFMKGLE